MTRLLLPYYTLFFIVTFVWPSWRIWRRSGINPLVLPRDDSALGVIGVWFKGLMLAVFALALAHFLGFNSSSFAKANWWASSAAAIFSSTLLSLTLLWLVVAQAQMGKSWRIGIDTAHDTQLVTHGLFGYSRNPIFLAMRLNLLGLFLLVPDGFSLAIFLLSEALIGVQVRLEEEHLRTKLGQTYLNYCSTVRRWI
jgi:protein-S-isoprenylcysteine O-methyltransferase Ste14